MAAVAIAPVLVLGAEAAMGQAAALQASTDAVPDASPSSASGAASSNADAASTPLPNNVPPLSQAPTAGRTDSSVRFRTAGVLVAGVGTTLAYGRAKWWNDGFSGGFKATREGWFGRGTDHGGADKLGHAMFTYAGTRLATRAFEWAGNDTDRALRLGVMTAVGTMIGVELIDGFSQKWRFSHEDAVANLAGGALGWWLERDRAADALIDVRIQYSRSTGPQGRRQFEPLGDYSGQRYLLVLKGSGVPAIAAHPLGRYLELSVGYGARNFEAESRQIVAPTRQVYFGVSLNLSELLRATAFAGNSNPSRTQRLTDQFLEYVQIPALAVQGDREIR
jgi:hypothetical protein